MPAELEKELRDELRLTAAMRCFSIMRSGSSKSTSAQHEYMFKLFHGDGNSVASNIEMLCNATYNYKDMYDVDDTQAVVSKTDSADAESRLVYSLKTCLHRDDTRKYYANIEITVRDLEKKGRNGKQLVSGRNLLDMAKKGTANYRKALSFAVKKFDLEKMEVIDSGNSIEDVIEFVRCEMYKHLILSENDKKKVINLDCDSEDLDDNKDLEDEYLTDIKNSTSKQSTIGKASSSQGSTSDKSELNEANNNEHSESNVDKKKINYVSKSELNPNSTPPKNGSSLVGVHSSHLDRLSQKRKD